MMVAPTNIERIELPYKSDRGHSSLALEATQDNTIGDAVLCLQCHKCTAGCPLAREMDIKPSQIVRHVQLGQWSCLLTSKAIWLCTSCHTCASRCPAGVDLSHIQDYLRRQCIEQGILPGDHRGASASRAMLAAVADAGRMNELAVMGRFKWDTKSLFERFALGLALFVRGKLKLLRNKSRSRKHIKRLVRRFLTFSKRKRTE